MQQQQFSNALSQQFLQIFQLSQQGADTSSAKLRTQGFIQAGELLGLVSRDEVSSLMDAAHQQVFGCSVAQRLAIHQQQAVQQEFRQSRRQALADGDYRYFDEPALQRLQP